MKLLCRLCQKACHALSSALKLLQYFYQLWASLLSPILMCLHSQSIKQIKTEVSLRSRVIVNKVLAMITFPLYRSDKICCSRQKENFFVTRQTAIQQ